jgi:hypothetical protein
MPAVRHRVYPSVGAVACYVANDCVAGAGLASMVDCRVPPSIAGKFAKRIARGLKGQSKKRALRGFATAALAAVAASPFGAGMAGTLSALAASIPRPATPGGGRRDAQSAVVVRTPDSEDEARELLADAADALDEAEA